MHVQIIRMINEPDVVVPLVEHYINKALEVVHHAVADGQGCIVTSGQPIALLSHPCIREFYLGI
jgi:ABC-type branched-subunit amino acid transport system ATPase component